MDVHGEERPLPAKAEPKPAGGRLGTERGSASAFLRTHRLLDGLRRVTDSDGLRLCGSRGIGGGAVELWRTESRAWLAGVQRCGLVHLCPVCSTRIRAARSAELAEAVQRHEALGGGVAFLTLTVPHTRGDDLGRLLDRLPLAFRRALSGREAARMRKKFKWGSVRVLELTYGANGWHAHYHAALFVHAPLSEADEAELASWWQERWASACLAVGLRRPSAERGVRLESLGCDAARVAAYMSKVGRAAEVGIAAELTRGDRKAAAGLSLWEIGHLAASGDRSGVELWREYEHAVKGRRLCSWSKGLRKRLVLRSEVPDDELSGEEIACLEPVLDAEAPEFVSVVFSWQLIQLGRQGRVSELLEAAAAKGAGAVALLLAELHPPPEQACRRLPQRRTSYRPVVATCEKRPCASPGVA